MTQRYRTALFPGSFNPFTTGHKSIADRILKIYDRLIIGIGDNIGKKNPDVDANIEKIRRLYAGDARVEVARYEGLTTDFAKEKGVDVMVRGVRNFTDFEYERNLAEVNLRISGIETLLLPALPELGYISSSMVRELQAFGKDVSEFLP